MKFGFGTQLWLRDNHFENFYRMLDEMSLVGLDGLECCFDFLVEWYEHRPAELRRLLEMHDIELASYYMGMAFHEPALRAHGAEEMRRRIRFVAEMGYQNVLLDGGRKQPNATPAQVEEHIKVIAETANELGALAHSCGVTLSWHQHWGSSILEDEGSFHRFMALTDPAVVGFCPDTAQLTLSGFDVVETIRRYAPRIRFVHYKDITFAGRPQGELWPGFHVPSDEGGYGVDSKGRFVELGRGVVDFAAVTQVLREAGYDGWFVDDFDFTGYSPRASAQACKGYMNLALGWWSERDTRCGLSK